MTAPRLNWASLVWETRGYLGLDEDAPVPVDELRETAMANGWSEREVREALRATDEVVPAGDDPTGDVQLLEEIESGNCGQAGRQGGETEPCHDRVQNLDSSDKRVAEVHADVDWTSIEHGIDPAGVDEYAAWMLAVDKRPWTPNAPTENRRSWSDPANWISAEETRQWLAMHPEIDGRAFILQSEAGNYDGKPDPYLFVDYDSVLSRHTLARLEEKATVASAHVRCVGSSAGVVLRRVIEQLPIVADVHRGTPLDDLVATLRDGLDTPAVLVLDEADDVPETDLLDKLALIPSVSSVVICHHPDDWLAHVDEQHRTTFDGDHHIPLSRYIVDELADILQVRAEPGLHPDFVDREQLEEIADLAAGVAREGIQTLREAALYAEERGHLQIDHDDIADGNVRALRLIREANIRSLPFHYQVLYELIRVEGPLTGTELHAFYDEVADTVYQGRAQTPVSRRHRRSIISKLREAHDAGLGVPEMERILREEVFPDMRGYEAERAARTAATGSAGRGAVSGIRDAGAPGKEWLATGPPYDRTREAHEEADGQIVPVGSKFTVGGEQLWWPGDPRASPWNFIQCRCGVAPAWELP